MKDATLTIHVNHIEAAPSVTEKEVRQAVGAALQAEGIANGEVSVTFLDAGAIASLNREHLGHPTPTDTISFNLAGPDAPFGDIFVCPDVAAESAEECGVSLREELLRLVIHGALHLAGHDHPAGSDRVDSEMFRRQEAILDTIL